jgi:hypothetical protein
MIFLCQNPVARLCAMMMLDLHNINEAADITVWDASTEPPKTDSTLNLCVDIQHAANNKIQGWNRVPWLKEHGYAVVECEDFSIDNPHILFYDFMWNRSKAYYTQRSWNYRPWYYHYCDDFLLQDISTAQEKTCLFLSPNKSNTSVRSNLNHLLAQYPGYSNTVLGSNCNNPNARCVADIGSNLPTPQSGYSPVHNAYYRETFFSVYVETIDSGTTQLISEKTLDPLIKGHFILPFGASGLVKYIKHQGWQLPEFIDYSYDQITDDQKRFVAFGQELSRLCNISMDDWCQHWVDNVDIVNYNRNQLFNRPYHRLEILNEM